MIFNWKLVEIKKLLSDQRRGFMTQILSHNSHDLLPMQIVPVIASFNDDGQIKPLYVGINGERYKVASCWVRRSFSNQIEFHCRLIDQDLLKPVIITYYLNECIWTIPDNPKNAAP